MGLYHRCDVKTGFTFAFQFFMLISDDLGGVICDVSICDQVKELALCELWGCARDLPSYNETEERSCHTRWMFPFGSRAW